MRHTRTLFSFLLRAVIVGLAAAFLVVWWRPTLLGSPSPTTVPAVAPPRGTAPAAVPTSAPSFTNPPPSAGTTTGGLLRANASLSFADAVARAAPAVVNIYTARVVTERTQNAPLDQVFGDYWPSYRQRVERSLGSGVIIDSAGTIVTNQHVIARADSIRVQLADGRIADATVTGQDPDTDLAILHLAVGNVPSMPLGRSDTLRVGDIVLAIGNPYGLSQTVTQGIVSATGRGQLGLATFENFIQTDAAINLGNSGGALIDVNGNLVGINTAVLNRTTGGPEGIGFAIPVNLVRGVTEQILTKGRVVRGSLGFQSEDMTPEQANQLGLGGNGGVAVVRMYAKSAAYEAGLRPGDFVTAVNGDPVKSAQDLVSRVAMLKPGASVAIEGLHLGTPFKVRLPVLERPQRSADPQG